MKKTAIAFGIFFLILLVGISLCLPGICGCALSILPASWESSITIPALVLDTVGLVGCAATLIMFLIAVTRRATIRSTETIVEQQNQNR